MLKRIRLFGIFAVVGWTVGIQPAVSATFTVTNTSDSGPGSLRQAINVANTNPGPDVITFEIPNTVPHTIYPTTELPLITDPVTIDGYTQSGSSVNTGTNGLNTVLMIELDGQVTAGGGMASGLTLSNVDDCTVRGLAIHSFPSNGISLLYCGNIHIEGNFIGQDVSGDGLALGNGGIGVHVIGSASDGSNHIGGVTAEARNLISANGLDGVLIEHSDHNWVQGNLVGTDVTGTFSPPAFGTGQGVRVYDYSFDNQIGGTEVGARNVISGFPNAGIGIENGSERNVVQGNFVGTDVSGTMAIPNAGAGVRVSANNNLLGGPDPAARNVISGNVGYGVTIAFSTNTTVQNNYIGTDVTGTQPLGNSWHGINMDLSFTTQNLIGDAEGNAGNVIAYNGLDGINLGLNGAIENRILGNRIFGNDKLGINLSSFEEASSGVNNNDPCDLDGTGNPNHFQNYPVVTNATSDGSSTTIEGYLDSTTNMSFTLEFFANTTCDPSGYGEGEVFLGSANHVSGESCSNAFSVTLPVSIADGVFISSTATDANGNTSEFSACAAATIVPGGTSPELTILPASPGNVIISWTLETGTNWVLQENLILSPSNWTNAPSGATNPVVVPITSPTKFYRLVKS